MNYHLICVNPFHGYVTGQLITDPDEVAKLIEDRDHHFVRINAPEPVPVAAAAPVAAPKAAKEK